MTRQRTSASLPHTHDLEPSSLCAPIGVFDSGVGGLTVLHTMQQVLPNESILYFGDTARLPYGTKTPAEIIHFVRDILYWMTSYQVKMVIMACNTSSALALETVQAEFDIPILGVILPAARAAVHHGHRIGVLATPATAKSHAYREAMHEIDPTVDVWEVGCPEFVPIIESSRIHTPETRAIVQGYLEPLLQNRIDTLVYGCTHYPHLSSIIRPMLPPSVRLIDPATYVATAAVQELRLLGDTDQQGKAETRFFVSDRPHRFTQVAARLMGYTPAVDVVEVGTPILSVHPNDSGRAC